MCGDDYTGDVPLGLLFFVLQLSFVLPQQLAWPNGGGLSRGPDLAWGFPGEVSELNPSLLLLHTKERLLQPCSGLGAASDKVGVIWSQGCKGQRWHH